MFLALDTYCFINVDLYICNELIFLNSFLSVVGHPVPAPYEATN